MSLDLELPRCPNSANVANGRQFPGCQWMLRSNHQRHHHLYHPLEIDESRQLVSTTDAGKMIETAANTRGVGLLFIASVLVSLSLVIVLTNCESFQIIRPIRAPLTVHQTSRLTPANSKGASSWLLPGPVNSTESTSTSAITSVAEASIITTVRPACTSLLGIDNQIITDLTGATEPTSPTRAHPNEPITFHIADIDIPVAEGDAPVNSAVRLLSALSDQLEEDGESDNTLRFRDSKVSITKMNLSMLNIYLQKDEEPKFSIGLSFFNTSVSGRFSYNGPVMLGTHYRMIVDNILLTSSSNLTNYLGILQTNDFSLNVTSLGYMTVEFFDDMNYTQPTKNYALKMLQKFIQKTIKRTYSAFEAKIRPSLEKAIRQLIDCELYHLSPSPINTDMGHKNYQHQLSLVVNKWIGRLKFDIFDLPDFQHEQRLVGVPAKVKFTNGSLSGLNHVYFSGDSRLKLQGEHLLLNSSLGWTDLRARYNWDLTMGNNTKNAITRGFVAFDIMRVELGAVITKGLSHHSQFVVEKLGIERLDGPKMDISGLPGMNRITRTVVNFFMNRLKERLVNSIQTTLKKQLERTLNKLPSLVL